MRAEAYTDADGASEDGKRAQMNAGVLENNENADDEDDVADDLRNRVLKRTIEAAVGEKTIKEETFRAGRDPEDRH